MHSAERCTVSGKHVLSASSPSTCITNASSFFNVGMQIKGHVLERDANDRLVSALSSQFTFFTPLLCSFQITTCLDFTCVLYPGAFGSLMALSFSSVYTPSR